jgi:hypothetical protein
MFSASSAVKKGSARAPGAANDALVVGLVRRRWTPI